MRLSFESASPISARPLRSHFVTTCESSSHATAPRCHLKIVRERAFVGGSRPNLAASAEPPNDDQRIVEADVPVFTREIPPSKSGMIQVLVANSKPSEAEDASCITKHPW